MHTDPDAKYLIDMYRFPANPYSILINTNNFSLTLYKNGKIFKTYPVAIGKPSSPTPKGNFKVKNKAYKPGGPFGARWLGLTAPGIGIHGTNVPFSIGKNVSHGCIRTYNKNIIELYNLVPIGTSVRII
jgi:lipoprotein-anchoring transpeptidase ErfK/SrfK